MAVSMSWAFRPFATSPVRPCCTSSHAPPLSETITGTPEAIASRTTLPKVSVVLGNTRMSDDAYAALSATFRQLHLAVNSADLAAGDKTGGSLRVL